MAHEDLRFKVTADIDPLRNTLSEVDQLFGKLDRAIGQHAGSISRTLSQLIGGYAFPHGSRSKRSALEQLTAPLLNQVISGVLGTASNKSTSQQPVSLAMNITTPDANSFRMSQGQILAEAASAIARATRRYL